MFYYPVHRCDTTYIFRTLRCTVSNSRRLLQIKGAGAVVISELRRPSGAPGKANLYYPDASGYDPGHSCLSGYDYRLYGEQRVRQEDGQFNECGYVSYHGTLALEELMREDPAEQYQREQGLQMGGLT